MFYVSDKLGNGLYSVTDTDDNVVENYAEDELINFVFKNGLKIMGVDITEGNVASVTALNKPYEFNPITLQNMLNEWKSGWSLYSEAKLKQYLFQCFAGQSFILRTGSRNGRFVPIESFMIKKILLDKWLVGDNSMSFYDMINALKRIISKTKFSVKGA